MHLTGVSPSRIVFIVKKKKKKNYSLVIYKLKKIIFPAEDTIFFFYLLYYHFIMILKYYIEVKFKVINLQIKLHLMFNLKLITVNNCIYSISYRIQNN